MAKFGVVYVDSSGNIVQVNGGGFVGVSEVNTVRLVMSSGDFAGGIAKMRAFRS